ncbi:oxygenase [Plantactinospora sp. BC1]|nr:oxygenase [Plantactinospora sp. BC1]
MLLTAGSVSEYIVEVEERGRIWDLAQGVAVDPLLHEERVRRCAAQLPTGLRNALAEFGAGASASGFLLIRGLEIGELPPTPDGHQATPLTAHGTTGLLAMVADALGRLVGYADEKNGALVHEVHPVRNEEHRIENSGAVAFDFHTENVHHPLRPDFLGLLCLRQDHEGVAATRVASVREAYRLLTEEQIATLRRCEYTSLYPTSFSRNTPDRPRAESGPHPVLFGGGDSLFMRYNSHNTRATSTAGRHALDALAVALEEVARDLVLAPGEMVVLDNHVAAHGRSAFRPRYDGADRWLRRFYSLRAVPRWAEQMSTHARVLPSMDAIAGVL